MYWEFPETPACKVPPEPEGPENTIFEEPKSFWLKVPAAPDKRIIKEDVNIKFLLIKIKDVIMNKSEKYPGLITEEDVEDVENIEDVEPDLSHDLTGKFHEKDLVIIKALTEEFELKKSLLTLNYSAERTELEEEFRFKKKKLKRKFKFENKKIENEFDFDYKNKIKEILAEVETEIKEREKIKAMRPPRFYE